MPSLLHLPLPVLGFEASLFPSPLLLCPVLAIPPQGPLGGGSSQARPLCQPSGGGERRKHQGYSPAGWVGRGPAVLAEPSGGKCHIQWGGQELLLLCPALLKYRGMVPTVLALDRWGPPGPEKGQDLLEISELTITFPDSVMWLWVHRAFRNCG